jgi:hypothetical protein
MVHILPTPWALEVHDLAQIVSHAQPSLCAPVLSYRSRQSEGSSSTLAALEPKVIPLVLG